MKKNFTIWADGEKGLEKAIKRLNRHAQKMGYGSASVVSVGKAYETKRLALFKDADGEVSESSYAAMVKDVEVDIPEQFLNMADAEWKVVGQVVYAEGQAEVVAEPEQMVKVGKFIEGFNWKCQTCGHSLKKAFVVENKADGRLMVVGVECLKQYTGADGQAIIAAIEFISVIQYKEGGDEGCGGGGGGSQNYKVIDLEDYMAVCVAVAVRDGGYVKRWEEREHGFYGENANVEVLDCTRNHALAQFIGSIDPQNDKAIRMYTRSSSQVVPVVIPTDADKSQAEALIKAWQDAPVLPKFDGSKDEYAEQCKFLAERGWVTEKTAGIAASMVKGPRVEKPNVSQYLGEVGKRQDFMGLKVVAAIEREGQYGITTILKFEDAAGNVLTWFASGCPGYSKDDVVDLKATVKSHDEYKGVKQTVISRAKELEKKVAV